MRRGRDRAAGPEGRGAAEAPTYEAGVRAVVLAGGHAGSHSLFSYLGPCTTVGKDRNPNRGGCSAPLARVTRRPTFGGHACVDKGLAAMVTTPSMVPSAERLVFGIGPLGFDMAFIGHWQADTTL